VKDLKIWNECKSTYITESGGSGLDLTSEVSVRDYFDNRM
jgi:hypothetical protein